MYWSHPFLLMESSILQGVDGLMSLKISSITYIQGADVDYNNL